MAEARATRTSFIPWAAAALLAASTIWVFAPVADFDFVAWDDDRLIYENRMVSQGLDAETLRWASTAVILNNWAPVAWFSHLLDVSLYGLEAGGHHVTSLVFHLLNALLLFLGLFSLTGSCGRSLFAAALFAVHPLHVESVAWLAERRDVLSMLFALVAFGAHARWARSRARWAYVSGLLALALGLASKAMLVSLPVLLLLIDHWPLRRGAEGARRLLLEKLPHALLVAVFVVITLATQQEVHGTALPLALRISNAVASYWVYLEQTLWPQNLSVLYPHPSLPGGPQPWSPLTTVVAGLLLAGVTGIALVLRRRPYLAAGWLWYVVSLLPVIGLVQVGQQAHADRYTYLPLIGIFVAVAWGGGDLVDCLSRGRTWPTRAAALGAALVVGVYALLAREQVGHWRDSVTLFEHATRVTEGNFQMHYNLAKALKANGDTAAAIAHYREAVAIHPLMGRAHYNLANLYRSEGRFDEAIQHYGLAAEAGTPRQAALQGLAAAARERDGNVDELVAWFQRGVDARPDSVDALVELGHAHRLNENREAAVASYRAAAALDPENAELQQDMAQAERDALGAP